MKRSTHRAPSQAGLRARPALLASPRVIETNLTSAVLLFFLNEPAPPEFSPLPLHAPLPILSVIIGYPFKTNSDATAEIGTAKFAMYTQNDGAWIKNVAEEARMVDAMRKGADLTVKGTSRSEEHTSELQSQSNLVCRLLLEKK